MIGGALKANTAMPTRVDVTVLTTRPLYGCLRKIPRYGFVAIDALSSGGALRVWKTTQ